MITVQTLPRDLLQVKFAYSPLIEASTSYAMLRGLTELSPAEVNKYGRVPRGHRQWLNEVMEHFPKGHLPYMDATILPSSFLADFVTPTPQGTNLNFEAELKAMLLTPRDVVCKNIELLIELDGETKTRQHFLDDHQAALRQLAQELDAYWSVAFTPHWEQMRRILENDVLYQARRMALEGVETVMQSLSRRLRFEDDRLMLEKSHYQTTLTLRGDGFQLVPSLFSLPCHLRWQINDDWRPMIIYGARGVGLWRGANSPDPAEALEITLGAPKARILVALTEPTSTGQLADMLYVTAGSVSQQLAKLSQAGLVTSHRGGNRVYYRLTTRGEDLLSVFMG